MGTTERRGGATTPEDERREGSEGEDRPGNDEVCLGYSGFLWPCEVPVFGGVGGGRCWFMALPQKRRQLDHGVGGPGLTSMATC